MAIWSVYILRCADDTLYTGISTDVALRVKVHNSGKGAKYTRARLPVELVYKKRLASGTLARKLEAKIKKLSRSEKLFLIKK